MIRALIDHFHRRSRLRSFDRELSSLGEEIAAWASFDQVTAVAQFESALIANKPPRPLQKGEPDILAIQKQWALALAPMLKEHPPPQAAAALAEKIAAIAPSDNNARRLALATFWLCNAKIIQQLRSLPARYVALHITCEARVKRALDSQASFSSIPSEFLTHLLVIGNGHDHRFDASSNILEVPAPDSYEHLASKVIDAYAILAFAPNVRSIIKMDDDHRLGDARKLLKILEETAQHSGATQLGHLYNCKYPAAHNHAWHFGKCQDPEISETPFAYPASLSWSTGEFGYTLNRSALLRMLWAKLYYQRWIKSILYEDIALGELCDKLGVQKRNFDLNVALRFHRAY